MPVKGQLILRGLADAQAIHATAWTSAALPQTSAIPLSRLGKDWHLKLDAPTVWWEIVLE